MQWLVQFPKNRQYVVTGATSPSVFIKFVWVHVPGTRWSSTSHVSCRSSDQQWRTLQRSRPLWLQSSHSSRLIAVLWVSPEQRGDPLQSPALMGSSSTYRPVQSAPAGRGRLLPDPPETAARRGPPASGRPSWIHSARSSEIKVRRLGEQGAERYVPTVCWVCVQRVWTAVRLLGDTEQPGWAEGCWAAKHSWCTLQHLPPLPPAVSWKR